MPSRAKWILSAGAALLGCYAATHYRGWVYRGGRLVDHGLLGYPRYEARLGDISLNATGTYSYTFSRFPAAEAVVMLVAPDHPPPAAIEHLATQVRLRVVSQDGTTICDGTGSPRASAKEGLWVTSSPHAVEGIYHQSCNRVALRRCNPCRLDVSIGPVDPATPSVRLVVTVQGGGVEFP